MDVMFVLVIMALVAAVAIPLSIYHSKATNEAWSRAADQLGLHFEPGGMFSSRAISGGHNGYWVHVDTFTRRSGKHSQTYTRFKVRYPHPLGMGLELTRSGFFSGVARFFGAQDIEVGDAGFDGETVVKGGNPKRVQEFLTPARRLRITRFLASYTEATIGDSAIEWTTRGLIRDSGRLVSHVNSMTRLAWHLAEDRPEDEQLVRVMAAQDDGRPEEALRMLAERHRRSEAARPADSAGTADPEAFQPEPVEERLLEGELLYLGGRHDEARAVLAKAARQSPDDAELQQWEQALTVNAGEPSAASPAKSAQPTDQGPLDAATVCEALFPSSGSSFSAYQVFEDRYAGKTVRWNGTLERVDEYSYDLVFHGQEGCKGVLAIHELGATPYGQRKVLAMVQFPPGDLETLRKRIGQAIEFSGRLVKADGLMRNLYLTEGRLLSAQ
jgi:hypothetical protein